MSGSQVTIRKDRVRLIALFYPKKDMSFEEFSKYWLEVHGPLFLSLEIVHKNILKYEQMHFDPKPNQLLSEGGPVMAPVPYYGMAIFEGESFEKIFEVFNHPEYQKVVLPDEERFFDKSRSLVIAGELATPLDRV